MQQARLTLLGALAFADIPYHAGEKAPRAEAHLAHCQLNRKRGRVPALSDHFAAGADVFFSPVAR